jgi:hypothetical protein
MRTAETCRVPEMADTSFGQFIVSSPTDSMAFTFSSIVEHHLIFQRVYLNAPQISFVNQHLLPLRKERNSGFTLGHFAD